MPLSVCDKNIKRALALTLTLSCGMSTFQLSAQAKAGGSATRPLAATPALTLPDKLYVEGKLAEAEKQYKEILSKQEKSPKPDQIVIAHATFGLARVMSAQGRLAEADSQATEALAAAHKVSTSSTQVLELIASIRSFRQDLQARLNSSSSAPAAEPAAVGVSVNAPFAASIMRSGFGRMNFAGSFAGFPGNGYTDASEAEFVLKTGIQYATKNSGPASMAVLEKTIELCDLYQRQMRYGEMVPLLKQIAAMYAKLPSDRQQVVATKLLDLAQSNGQARKMLEADSLISAVIKSDVSNWTNAVEMSTRFEQLANTFQGQQLYPDAEGLWKADVAIKEKWLPANDTQLAKARISLAKLYELEHKLSAAQELYEMALAAEEKAHGEGNGQGLEALVGIEQFYLKAGKIEKAKDLVPKLTKAMSASNVKNQRFVLQQVMQVVISFADHGETDTAGLLLDELMKTHYASDTGYQYQVAQDLQKLAVSFAAAGQIDQAERTYNILLDTRRYLPDNYYPTTAEVQADLARLMFDHDKFDKGMIYSRKIGESVQNGTNVDRAIVIVREMAAACQTSNHLEYAEELYKIVTSFSSRSARNDVNMAVRDYCTLASVYAADKKKTEAADAVKQAEQLVVKALSTEAATETGKDLDAVIVQLLGKDQLSDAVHFLEDMANTVRYGYNGNGYSSADVLMRIAMFYEATDLDKSGQFYQRALAADEKMYGTESMDLVNLLSTYARYLRKCGKVDDALKVEARSAAIMEQARSPNMGVNFRRPPIMPR
jgi:hypothetical protein